jgi:hypothetical protein
MIASISPPGGVKEEQHDLPRLNALQPIYAIAMLSVQTLARLGAERTA